MNYKVWHMKAAILAVIGGLLVARGYQNRAWMFDLIESRKPFDSDLVASIGGLVGSPKASGYLEQLAAIHAATQRTHRSTRLLISSRVGAFETSNVSVVPETIVPAQVTNYAMDYWQRTKDPELLKDGYGWSNETGTWHMIVRPFTLGSSGKFMYVVLITNMEKSISAPWKQNISGLFLMGLMIILVVGIGGVVITIPVNAIAKSIERDEKVIIQGWWPLEFKALAEEFNAFAQREKQNKEELKESHQQLEDMYRRLRHDIISAIGGVNNMLIELERIGFPPDEKYQEAWSLARAKAEVAYELVSTTGKLGQELSIRMESIADLFEILRVNYSENNVKFLPSGAVKIPVDKNTFCLRVLANLISNAIKYSNPPDEVVEVGVKLSKKGDTVIYVRDNGKGLSNSEIQKIMNNHGQSARLKPEIPGSGTGLHTASQVVKQHGFTLGVRSSNTPGASGSIFYVTIPKEVAKWQ